MIISGITPAMVWTNSSRSLTNFGSGALTSGNSLQTSIAANTAVLLGTSAGIFGQATVAVATGAGATAAINVALFDGTNAIQMVATAAAANAAAAFSSINTNAVGLRLFNFDATHAGFYMVSQILFTQ